jgi:peptidoglycan L-alanyl-D-glutamate endopeptidase CwlK
MRAFGRSSEGHLAKVHPRLVACARRALQAGQYDFSVTQGARTDEECFVNFGKGRTAAECLKGGCPAKYAQPDLPKVTWLGHALSSNHRVKGDGFGHAVDLLPEPYDYKDRGHFVALRDAMLAAAKAEGVRLRWGGDWDGDGHICEHGETDLPHFELLP